MRELIASNYQVVNFDCPECGDWNSVKLWIAVPAVWRCEKCTFLFELRELIRHQHDPDF